MNHDRLLVFVYQVSLLSIRKLSFMNFRCGMIFEQISVYEPIELFSLQQRSLIIYILRSHRYHIWQASPLEIIIGSTWFGVSVQKFSCLLILEAIFSVTPLNAFYIWAIFNPEIAQVLNFLPDRVHLLLIILLGLLSIF